MKIVKIVIERANYGPNKGKFESTISVEGGSYGTGVTIPIPDEMLSPIVNIIEQAVVQSMANASREFAESVAVSLIPPVEHVAIASDADVIEGETPTIPADGLGRGLAHTE